MAKVGNPSLFSSASGFKSQSKSHTFTANLAAFAPRQDGVKNRGSMSIGVRSKYVGIDI